MDEYISKQGVYRAACAGCTCHGDEIGSCFSSEPCEKLVSEFASAYAADVAPVVHGRWVTYYRSGTTVAEGYVSTCCDMWNNRKSDYCPNCGAKMDESMPKDGAD